MSASPNFPKWITAALGAVQLILTIAIIGTEVGSIYIDAAHGTIWAGVWAGIIFICVSLNMLCITCRCRTGCYSLYAFVLNSMLLGGAVMCLNVIFMNDICRCFLGDQWCCSITGLSSFQTVYTARSQNCTTASQQGRIAMLLCPSVPYDKAILVKAQLGCASAMVIACGIYVTLFLFSWCGICFDKN